jgi:hypothetical protein
MKNLVRIFAFVMGIASANAQIEYEQLKLQDGTKVSYLVGDADENGSQACFYLPANMRISTKNNLPEFSFLSYRQDSLSPVQGGIMHLLMTWGLDEQQETEFQSLLTKKDSTLRLAGAYPIISAAGLMISSNHPVAKILRESMSGSGQVPVMPNDRMAASFRFNAEQANRMIEAIENNENLEEVRFRFNFEPKGFNLVWKTEISLGQILSTAKKCPPCIR